MSGASEVREMEVVNSQEAAVALQRPKAVRLAVCNFHRSSLSIAVNRLALLADVGKVIKNEKSAAEKFSPHILIT